MARPGIVDFLTCRAQSNPETKGYSYVLGLTFDVMGGVPAWHCADIPFMFHNAYRVGNCNIEGVTDKIESDMAGALVAFAKTGDPNHEGMVEWRPFTLEDHATMVFDRETACKADYDAELMEALKKYTKPFEFNFPIPDEDDEEGRAWMY